MTADEQSKVDAIERDRRRRERELLLILLLLCDESRSHATAAVRLGHDPLEAARNVIVGADHIEQPGLADGLAETMGVAHAAGIRRVYRMAGESRPAVDVEASALRYGSYAKDATQRLADAITGKLDDALSEQATPSIPDAEKVIRFTYRDGGWVKSNHAALDLVSETAILRAYNDGMFAAYRTPAIAERLVGFHHVSILDERTTPICDERSGLTLRATDSYWLRNWPMLHFRCRSCVLPIWKGEPFEESTWRPETPAMPGFGEAPAWVTALRYALN